MEGWWLLLSYSSIDIALASNVSQCKARHIRLLSLFKRPVKFLVTPRRSGGGGQEGDLSRSSRSKQYLNGCIGSIMPKRVWSDLCGEPIWILVV